MHSNNPLEIQSALNRLIISQDIYLSHLKKIESFPFMLKSNATGQILFMVPLLRHAIIYQVLLTV